MARLVLLTRKLDQGGAERQLVGLAKALKERGFDVHVVLFYAGGVFDGELAAAGVPTHFAGKKGRWDALGFLVRLARIMRRLRPRAVYSFLDLPNVLAAVLRPVIGRPRLVWSIRAAGMEMRHYDWLSRLVPNLETALSRAADLVVANSHAGKAWAVGRGFRADRILVVGNGIDTRRFQFDPNGRTRVRREWGVSDSSFLIGLVARLDPMKDHETFLRAAGLIAGQRPDLRFVCVGTGPGGRAKQLRTLAAELGLADRIVWAGPRSDLAAVHSALDIASSSSSYGEGFSNAIGEAMACARICVVTDVGDSLAIVGDCGIGVPPRDPEALAKAWLRIVELPASERQALGHRAQARVEVEFGVEQMVRSTIAALTG